MPFKSYKHSVLIAAITLVGGISAFNPCFAQAQEINVENGKQARLSYSELDDVEGDSNTVQTNENDEENQAEITEDQVKTDQLIDEPEASLTEKISNEVQNENSQDEVQEDTHDDLVDDQRQDTDLKEDSDDVITEISNQNINKDQKTEETQLPESTDEIDDADTFVDENLKDDQEKDNNHENFLNANDQNAGHVSSETNSDNSSNLNNNEASMELGKKFTYEFDEETKTAKITGIKEGEEVSGSLVIPDYIQGDDGLTEYAINGIGENAFLSNTGITELFIGKHIQTIGSNAFSTMSDLEAVYFDKEASIDDGTTEVSRLFRYSKNLKKVVLPETLRYIPKGAFEECASLREVLIPEHVKIIKSEAFKNTKSLLSVVLPEELTQIDRYAFKGSAIESLVIPSMVTIMGDEIVASSQVKEVTFENDIASKGFARNAEKLERINFSSTMKEIGEEAFYGCTSLNKVVIPDSVTTVGKWAFRDCTAIKEVVIGSHAQLGKEVFRNNTALIKAVFKDGSTSTGDGTFNKATSLSEVILPDSIKTIGSSTFSYTAIKDLKLPKNLEKIGYSAFSYSAIEKMVIPQGVELGMTAFLKSNIEEIELHTNKVPTRAFVNTQNLKKVILGSEVTEIAKTAFEGSALETIDLSENLQTVDPSAFKKTNVKQVIVRSDVELPDALSSATKYYLVRFYLDKDNQNVFKEFLVKEGETIPSLANPERDNSVFTGWSEDTTQVVSTVKNIYAKWNSIFAYNGLSYEFNADDEHAYLSGLSDESLIDIDIPEFVEFNGKTFTVTKINQSAFENLQAIKTISMADSILEIEYAAFKNMKDLESIKLSKNLKIIGGEAFRNAAKLKEILLPEGLHTIKWNAFTNCSSLTKLVLPKSLSVIQSGAFNNADGLLEIEFSSNLDELGDYAFANLDNLRFVKLPSNVTVMGEGVFAYNTKLESVDLNGLDTIGTAMFAGNAMLSNVDLSSVRSIGSSAFKGASNLKNVNFSENLSEIGNQAFLNSGLKKVEINSKNKQLKLGEEIFAGSKQLESFVLTTPITSIPYAMFKDCSSLSLVELPETIETIEREAFANCTSLTRFTMPRDLKRLGSFAFSGAKNIQEYIFNTQLTTLGDYVFKDNASLETIVLPDTISELPVGIFFNNQNLKTVTLPKNLKIIGINAFYNNIQLKELHIPASVELIKTEAFYKADRLKKLVFEGKLPNLEPRAIHSNIIKFFTVKFFDAEGKQIGQSVIVQEGNAATAPAIEGIMNPEWNENIETITNSLDVYLIDKAAYEFQLDSKNETAYISGIHKSLGSFINLPKFYEHEGKQYRVVGVLKNAFENQDVVQKLIIPKSYNSFEDAAFKSLTNLKEVIFEGKKPENKNELFNEGVAIYYTLTFFDADGNKIGESQIVKEGSSANAPEVKELKDKVFIGWSENVNQVYDSFDVRPDYRDYVEYVFDEQAGTADVLKIYKSGDIVIPSEVMHNGVLYKVQGIKSDVLFDGVALNSLTFGENLRSINNNAFDQTSIVKKIVFSGKKFDLTLSGIGSSTEIYYTVEFINPENQSQNKKLLVKAGDNITTGIPDFTAPDDMIFDKWDTDLNNISDSIKITAIFKKDPGSGVIQADYTYTYNADTREATLIKVGDAVSGVVNLVNAIEHEGISYVLSHIGKNAFKKNNLITEVILPKTIKTIGDSAFEACKNLAKINLNEGLEIIGQKAFKDCVKLQEVIFPKSLHTISWQAFRNCDSLLTLVIPETVQKMGTGVFSNCDNLKSVKVLANPTQFYASSSKVYEKILPSSTFSGCKNLETVELNDEIETIGSSAFAKCENLREIKLPSNLKSIESSAFENNTSLVEIIIPESVTSIGSYAFRGNTSLKKVLMGDKVSTIGSYAFEGNTSLIEIHLSEALEIIEKNTFANTNALRHIDIPNKVKIIEDSAFKKSGLEEVRIPDSVVSIGDYAFEGMANLKKVVFGKNVKTVGDFAFRGAKNLLELQLNEGLEELGQYSFSELDSIKEIKLPDSIREVSSGLFYGNENLEKVNIPTSLEKLAGSMFQGNTSLKEIIIPDNIKNIGGLAFSGSGLVKVVIPDSVISIGKGAFSYTGNLTEVKLPKYLTEIADRLFQNSKNLKKIILPDGILIIGENAFAGSGIQDLIFRGNHDDLLLREGAIPDGAVSHDYLDWIKDHPEDAWEQAESGNSNPNPSNPNNNPTQPLPNVNSGVVSNSTAQVMNLAGNISESNINANVQDVLVAENASPLMDAGPNSVQEQAQTNLNNNENTQNEKVDKPQANVSSLAIAVQEKLAEPRVQKGVIAGTALIVLAALVLGALRFARKFRKETK